MRDSQFESTSRAPAVGTVARSASPACPDPGDVVVRRRAGDPAGGYALSTVPGADQLLVRTYEDAIDMALKYAALEGVRAWFNKGVGHFVLLDSVMAASQAE